MSKDYEYNRDGGNGCSNPHYGTGDKSDPLVVSSVNQEGEVEEQGHLEDTGDNCVVITK